MGQLPGKAQGHTDLQQKTKVLIIIFFTAEETKD